MKAMKKLALAMLCLIGNLVASSQSEDYTTAMDSLFYAVSKTPVTSGIWYDRVFSAARLHAFNVITDTVEGPLIEQAYFEIYNAAYNKTGFLGIDEYSYIAELERFRQRVPISVIDYTMQYLKPDAVQQGQLNYTNGLFYNVPGQSPFNTKRVQMAGPLKENIPPGWVKFSLPDLLCAGNNGVTVQSVQLNFGVSGILNLGLNQVDSIYLGTLGEKYFTVTTFYSGGQQFISKCLIKISYSGLNNSPEGPPPTEDDACFSESIQSQIPFQGYDESQSYKGWNTVNYYYRFDPSINCSVEQKRPLNKPVLIIDGFDPTNKRLAKWLYDSAFLYYNPNTNSVQNLGFQMRSQGYDLVIVNHPDYTEGTRIIQTPSGPRTVDRLIHGGGDYTERNAMVLVKIIQDVNAQLAAQGSTEKIVVVGPSMGGQISRIALKYMEDNIATTGPHNCRLWISMDSHQQGSVVPIGLQEFAKAMSKFFFKAKYTYDVQVNAPIAKQALLHHNLANSETPAGAPGFFDRYLSYMNNLGYPQNLRKIAGNSGAQNGHLQNPGFTCSPSLELGSAYGGSFIPTLIESIFGAPKHTQKVSLSPDRVQSRCEVLNMDLKFGPVTLVKKKVYAKFPIYRPYDPRKYDCSLEMLPGGYYPGFREITDSLNSTSQIMFTSIWDYLGYWMRKKKWIFNTANVYLQNHTHQVTGSTLGYGLGPHPNPNRKWDDDVTGVNLSAQCDGEIPFDGYFGPSNFNTRHDALFYDQAIWFINEINGIKYVRPPTYKSALISSDRNLLCSGETATFSLSPVIPGMVYNWTTSDPFLQIISGQGTSTITVQHNGTASNQGLYAINCSAANECYIANIIPYNFWVGKYNPVWTYNSPTNELETLQQTDGIDPVWNDACMGIPIIAHTRPLQGRTVVWEAVKLIGAGITWSQSGDDLHLNFLHVNQIAKFIVHVTNACGTADFLYFFRAVDGQGFCPYAERINLEDSANSLKLFPNPSSGILTVSLDEVSETKSRSYICEIRIIDKMGYIKQRYQYEAGIQSANININELSIDVYSVLVYDGKIWRTARLIKK